jgi:prepilin-type N-terminal cleavage/methylation domain-containing protein
LKLSRGFSLIELIAVLVISAVLFAIVLAKLPENNLKILQARTDVTFTLRSARQLALLRSGSGTTFTVVITNRSVDLQENNSSLHFPGYQYPLILPDDVSITQGLGVLNFDDLGNTQATQITIYENSLSETINLNGVGYAY